MRSTRHSAHTHKKLDIKRLTVCAAGDPYYDFSNLYFICTQRNVYCIINIPYYISWTAQDFLPDLGCKSKISVSINHT